MLDHPFKDHINKFSRLSDDEFIEVLNYFKQQTFAKKKNLLNEGQNCNSIYFVLKGLLRKFFINEKGVEQTTEFAIENWWMTDSFAFLHESTTEFYIQAVEQTDLLVIHRGAYYRMLEKHPAMEKYFRCVYQKAYAMAQMRVKFQYEYSREQLYHHFRKAQPQFLQRVPQYLIASYLGFTPEYLSEIRKKSIS